MHVEPVAVRQEYRIGIDPGWSGGIAILSRGNPVPDVIKMPGTFHLLLEQIGAYVGESGVDSELIHVRAMLESVHSMPRDSAKAAFSFGRAVGGTEAMLAYLKIPYDTVAPNTWQRVLGCQTKGDKNITKAKAKQMFPSVRVTHWSADAILLAAYALRVYPWERPLAA